MLRGQRRQQQQQPEYLEDDMLSDEYYSDVEGDIVTEQQGYAPPEDAVVVEDDQHLTPEMFERAQTITLDIDIMASPTELETGLVANEWKLLPHLPKHLKQNMAQRNRHQADGEQLAGNLSRCIPLQLEIMQQKNSLPFAMAIEAPGMLPKSLHRHGACLWRVPPDTPTMKVNEMAFEPNTVVTRHMYNNYRVCTLEDLNDDIKVHQPQGKNKKAYGTVAVGSLAYDTLIENLEHGNWEEELHAIDVEDIFTAPEHRRRTVEVTPKMANQLKELLSGPIREVIEGCINLEDFTIKAVRADGQPSFSSPKGLHQELVGSDADPHHLMNSERLTTRGLFSVKAKLHYILW